jgi:phytoene dehydrogenase-like protein
VIYIQYIISVIIVDTSWQFDLLWVQEDTECHHIVVEDWLTMSDSRGCLFVSIPSLLDSSLAPEGARQIIGSNGVISEVRIWNIGRIF